MKSRGLFTSVHVAYVGVVWHCYNAVNRLCSEPFFFILFYYFVSRPKCRVTSPSQNVHSVVGRFLRSPAPSAVQWGLPRMVHRCWTNDVVNQAAQLHLELGPTVISGSTPVGSAPSFFLSFRSTCKRVWMVRFITRLADNVSFAIYNLLLRLMKKTPTGAHTVTLEAIYAIMWGHAQETRAGIQPEPERETTSNEASRISSDYRLPWQGLLGSLAPWARAVMYDEVSQSGRYLLFYMACFPAYSNFITVVKAGVSRRGFLRVME